MIWTTVVLCILVKLATTVTTDNIFIEPRGNRSKYVGDDLFFTCFHLQSNITLHWYINGTELQESENRFHITELQLMQYNYTRIEIENVTSKLNNTILTCGGYNRENNLILSNAVKILLQGPPTEVVSPEISLIDFNLYINWERPHSIVENDDIQYLVMVENRTSSIITKSNFSIKTFFRITSDKRRIACDDLVFTIIPKNKVGEGNGTTIYFLNKAPKLLDYILTPMKDIYTLHLIMNSPICTMPFMLVENINLNMAYINEENFTNFTLDYTRPKGYYYLLNTLNLQKRFEINFNMSISNSNSTEWISFNINTHNMKEVIISSSSENQLRIQINTFVHTKNYGGAIIALLYCLSESCHEIDYNNSIYITTNHVGPFQYEEDYKNGFYEIYAYDTSTDGEVFSSDDNNNISYSIPRRQVYLESLATNLTDSTSPKRSNCSYRRSNTTVASQCDIKKSGISKQQLLLFSVMNKNKMYISAPTDKDNIVCLQIEVDDENYLAINTPILNFTEVYANKPIGRSINFIQSFDTELRCNLNQPQNDGPKVVLIASLSTTGGLLFVIVVGVFICVGFYCVIKKDKQKRSQYGFQNVSKKER